MRPDTTVRDERLGTNLSSGSANITSRANGDLAILHDLHFFYAGDDVYHGGIVETTVMIRSATYAGNAIVPYHRVL